MSETADILERAGLAPRANDDPVDRSSFERGLRSGLSGASSGLNRLVGTMGESLGYDNFARRRYEEAARAAAEAEAEAPPVRSFADVHDLRTGGQWLTGMLGQSVPVVAAGLGAAALGRTPLRSLAAATAATTPFEAGNALNSYAADPTMAAASADERLRTALPVGAGAAAAQMAVPVLMGGKLLGRGVADAAGRSFGTKVATNVAEGAAGNAAAGVGAEGIRMAGETSLDPNRDTSKDTHRLDEAGISGAALGGVFGLGGAAGEVAHGAIGSGRSLIKSTGDKLGGMAGDLGERAAAGVKAAGRELGGATQVARDAAQAAREAGVGLADSGKFDDAIGAAKTVYGAAKDKVRSLADVFAKRDNEEATAGRILKDEPVSPVTDEASYDASERTATEKAKQYVSDLMGRFKVSDDVKAKVGAAAQDLGDAANRAMVAGEWLAAKSKEKLTAQIASLRERVMRGTEDEDTKQSADYSGTRAVIRDVLLPAVEKNRPELLGDEGAFSALSDSLAAFVKHIDEGKPMHRDDAVMAHLYDIFGDDTRHVLEQLHSAVGLDTAASIERFYTVLNDLHEGETSQKVAYRIVADNIDPAHEATPDQIRDAASVINNFLSGRVKSKTPAEDRYRNNLFNAQMREVFGDRANKVLEQFNSLRKQRDSEEVGRQAVNEDAAVNEDVAVDEDAATMNEGEFDPFDRQLTEHGKGDATAPARIYGGKDSPFVPTHEAHVRDFANEDSQHSRLMKRAQEENPDRSVSSIPAREYARLMDMPEGELNRLTGGKPDDYATIVAEGLKQEGQLTPEQARNMLLESKSRGGSKSRINTERTGVTLDAVKVTAEAMKTMAYIDGETYMERTARAFKEGLGSALDFFNTKLKGELPGDTVVAYRGDKPLTIDGFKEIYNSRKPSSEGNKYEDMTPHELRTESQALEDMLEPLRAEVAAGLKYEKLSKKEYAAKFRRGMEDLGAKPYEDELFRIDSELRSRDDGPKEQTAMHGQKAEEEIHLVEADPEAKKRGIEVQFGLDGQPITYARPGAKLYDEGAQKLTFAGKMALQDKFNKMMESKNVIERNVGERGDALMNKLNDMRSDEQLRMLSLVGDPSVAKAAQVINKLTGSTAKVEGAPTQFEAVTEAIKAGGKTFDAAIKRVATSNDTIALKASLDHLLKQPKDPNINIAVDAINRRLTKLVEKDPSVTYGMQLKSNERVLSDHTISEAQKGEVKAIVEKLLGKEVKVVFERIMHAGDFQPNVLGDILRVSVHALNPTSVAYHEAVHGFFKNLRTQNNHAVFESLYKTADSKHVMDQLTARFKDEPSVLKQLETNKEERVAYMYQLWAADQLTVAPSVKNIFTKIKEAILNVMGIWTNQQRAEHILNYFHEGEFAKNIGDKNAVAKALLEPGTNKLVKSVKKAMEPVSKMSDAVLSAGGERLRDTGIPSFERIADLVMPKLTSGTKDPGFLAASRAERTQRMNNVVGALGAFTKEEIATLHDALKTGTVPTDAKLLGGYNAVRKSLDSTFEYMHKAGVAVSDLGYGKDYFPRVWDAEFISKHQQEFKDMLGKYVISGDLTHGEISGIMNRLMALDGAELSVEVDRPGMQHMKNRTLSFIKGEDSAPFVNKNLMEVLNNYTSQATRRAEWARRFNDDGSAIRALIDEGVKEHGATRAQVDMVQDYIRSVNGTLGDHINPTARRMIGNTIVYQNLRLLPLAIFSSLIDPLGIAVRGGTVGEALSAFKRGIAEIPRGFSKDPKAKDDSAYAVAEAMGIIDNTALMHTIGTMYSQGMVSSVGRRVNDALFRFNLMEQFNTSMRVSATEAAMNFIKRHAAGEGKHSERYLKELGLDRGDIIVRDGRPLLTAEEFMAHGMDEAQAVESSNKIRGALNRWVDGAVLRPNASDKPIWMNDPHWALIAHLKQFTYSFQHTILERVSHELENGNYAPALALASYVPVMIAADLVKGMIQGGGQQPAWKQDWGAADYVESGIERAGLYGVGQFAVDSMKNIRHGGVGIDALLGPAANQMVDGLKVVAGRERFGTFGLQSMPANALYGGFLKNVGSVSDPNFAD